MESISVDKAIIILNELVEADPEAMHQLAEYRTACNEKLEQHPTVQIVSKHSPDNQTPLIGLLGILNALFGKDKDGWGYICAVYDKYKLVKFVKTKDIRSSSD